jgi:hypothetical protein
MPESWTASCYDLFTAIEVVAALDGCVVGGILSNGYSASLMGQ